MVLNGTICTFYCGSVNRFTLVCLILSAASDPLGCFKKSVNIQNSKMQMSPRVLEKGLWTSIFQFNLKTATGKPSVSFYIDGST